VAATAVTAFAALPLSSAQASKGPWPHGGHENAQSWRFVGEYDSSLICEAQGTELVFSGGAKEYRCEDGDGSSLLYIR
jgi:hypothetical protein